MAVNMPCGRFAMPLWPASISNLSDKKQIAVCNHHRRHAGNRGGMLVAPLCPEFV
jgi:hypothetical protein